MADRCALNRQNKRNIRRGAAPLLSLRDTGVEGERKMLFQVLTREATNTSWHPYATATADPVAVIRLIQLANQIATEVTVVQADSEEALVQVLRDLARGAATGHSSSPVPSLTATPRMRMADLPLDQRRWEIEIGPGSDHDQPYAFVLPPGQEVLTSWLRLFARQWRARDLEVTGETVAPNDALESASEPEPRRERPRDF